MERYQQLCRIQALGLKSYANLRISERDELIIELLNVFRGNSKNRETVEKFSNRFELLRSNSSFMHITPVGMDDIGSLNRDELVDLIIWLRTNGESAESSSMPEQWKVLLSNRENELNIIKEISATMKSRIAELEQQLQNHNSATNSTTSSLNVSIPWSNNIPGS